MGNRPSSSPRVHPPLPGLLLLLLRGWWEQFSVVDYYPHTARCPPPGDRFRVGSRGGFFVDNGVGGGVFLYNLLLIPVGQGPAPTELSKGRTPKESPCGVFCPKHWLSAHRLITVTRYYDVLSFATKTLHVPWVSFNRGPDTGVLALKTLRT